MPPMRAEDLSLDLDFETLAVHAGAEPDEATGSVAPPNTMTVRTSAAIPSASSIG